MDVFSIFNLIGGLALFLFGMQVMSSGLTKLSGSKLEGTLRKMTSSKYRGIALGTVVTAVIQSSSAVTVMLVGLVNSGFLQLGQSIGVIMGTNIGTTITAWILSLAGIESSNFFIKFLNPNSFSPILAIIGVGMTMMAKSSRKRDIGSIMVGFAVLIFGMKAMSSAVAPLADMPEFTNILVMFSNPVLGVLVGTAFTAIIQSSSASVGILQAISMTGAVTYGTAIPIIMGQNIGTCVTALISSIGANKNARRVSIVHIMFNLIGTIVFLVIFYTINAIVPIGFITETAGPVGIAIIHSVFNIATTILLMPFARQLEKLAHLVVRDKNGAEKIEFLDERLLPTASIAVTRCREMTLQMAVMAKEALNLALDMIFKYDNKKANIIMENETTIDLYEDKLGTYLIKIEGENLDKRGGQEVSMLLYNIGDFERIGDHAVNILQSAQEKDEKNLIFSGNAQTELKILCAAIREVLDITLECFEREDISMAQKIEPLEDVIDDLRAIMRSRHIVRLRDGLCTLEMGFIYQDLLTNLERVADHCSNIAVSMIEINEGIYDPHEYLRQMKSDAQFKVRFEEYRKKYSLPAMNETHSK